MRVADRVTAQKRKKDRPQRKDGGTRVLRRAYWGELNLRESTRLPALSRKTGRQKGLTAIQVAPGSPTNRAKGRGGKTFNKSKSSGRQRRGSRSSDNPPNSRCQAKGGARESPKNSGKKVRNFLGGAGPVELPSVGKRRKTGVGSSRSICFAKKTQGRDFALMVSTRCRGQTLEQ